MNIKTNKTKKQRGEVAVIILIVVAMHLPFLAAVLPPGDTINPIPEASTKW